MSVQPQPWPEIPEATARAARAAARKGDYPLAMRVRDELGDLFADAEFAEAFGARGRPGWSPGRLALVTVLQKVENLTDRAAAHRVRYGMDWKYALGLELDDEGFDPSVLSEFRTRVAGHGLEEKALDLLLEKLGEKGLLGAGGKQRTDSTHVVSAVRDLNRLELAGEAVRAALEALAAAEPRWVAATLDVAGWGGRYRRRVDSWRLPTSQAKRDELAVAFGRDGFALLQAVYAPAAPAWLAELPAVEALRVVLVQNYLRTTGEDGREVVRRREAKTDGLPPGRCRLTSPYDTDARWGAKRDTFWNGYKVHISETCDAAGETTAGEPAGGSTESCGDPAGAPTATAAGEAGATAGRAGAATAAAEAGGGTVAGGPQARRTGRPNLITNVATTDASVADAAMTAPIHRGLARRRLTPDRHYVDSGYPSADLLVSSKAEFGITLVTPLLADTSPQARAGAGFDRTAFAVDWDAEAVTCPQGNPSASWTPRTRAGAEEVVVRFSPRHCQPCPVRTQCTTSRNSGRQLTLRPREVQQVLDQARAEQDTEHWQADYALRAGVEGTMHQAVAATGIRRSRYRGLGKTHLDHVYSAAALNLIRLDAYWNDEPLDRTRTSHLARLELAQAA